MKEILFSDTLHVWEAFSRKKAFLKAISAKIKSDVSQASIKSGELVYIGDNCEIGPYAVIEGPVWIGSGCIIRPHAYIRAGSIIGDGAVIGHSTEIVRSIIFPRAKLPHFNYVGDSIIGEEVNLGAGVKCANMRLDEKEINISYEGKKYETGLKKLGAIIGNRSSLGCNAVLNPGTILFPESMILPGKEIKGVVSKNEKIVSL